MKNFLIVILAFLLIVAPIGCNRKSENTSSNISEISQSANTSANSVFSSQSKDENASENYSSDSTESVYQSLLTSSQSGSVTSHKDVVTSNFTTSHSKAKNEEARKALQKILDKEERFTFKCLVFDKEKEGSLERFSFPTVENVHNAFVPHWCTYLDFDRDGIEELLIVDMSLQFALILRFDNGKVIGYIIEDLDIRHVKTDGSFQILKYNIFTSISHVSFDGLQCNISNLAYKSDSKNVYQIMEKNEAKEKVEEYFDDWYKNVTRIEEWTNLLNK